jgi:hypothetical protein
MSAVEIRLNAGDLSREMSAMRFWLDEHRVDVSGFSCSHQEDHVVVRVEFARAREAHAFADRFADGTTSGSVTDRTNGLVRGTLVPGLSSTGIIG